MPVGRSDARLLISSSLGAVSFLTLLLCRVPLAGAGEIVPSVNYTRSTDGELSRAAWGLALRGHVLPLLKAEIAASYRSESQNNGDLKVRTWPVTTSLYFAPAHFLYAGAGVGWYHTTLDYAETVPFKDETQEKFGVHLGGGIQVPLSTMASVDLGGRYVHMQKQESHLVPNSFHPDFWTTTIGLAIRF